MFDTLTDRFDADLHAPSRPRPARRRRGRRGAARDPGRAPRGRRQPRRRPGPHRADPRALHRRRARQEPHPRPAGHQGRQRGAHRHLGRRGAQDHLRLEAADGRAARRPAGLGQDDRRRQARPLVQASRAATRCSSAPTCSARPPSSSCGCSAREVGVGGLLRADRSGRRSPARASPRPTASGATSSSSTPPAGSPSTRS